MKITDFDIKKYSLPLAKPLTIGNHKLTSRQGVIISLTDEAGLTGCGEAAPLPGLHKETLQQVVEQLSAMKDEIIGLNVPARPFDVDSQLTELLPKNLYPSVRLAIEMAIFDLCVQRDHSFINKHDVKIPINGLVMAQADNLFGEIESLLSAGYRSIKIKVGRQSAHDDIRTIRKVKSLVGQKADIRLDANRLWNLDEAVGFCHVVGCELIDYIEEPLDDPGDYPAFFEQTDMPAALDETLAEKAPGDIGWIDRVRAFVLKPSVLGGLEKTCQLIDFAKSRGIAAVLSSAFESDVSLRIFALFAARMQLTDTPVGLDTLKWFSTSLLEGSFKIKDGRIDIKDLLAVRPKLKSQLLQDVG